MQELSGVSEAPRELAMSRFPADSAASGNEPTLQLVVADSKLPFRTAQIPKEEIVFQFNYKLKVAKEGEGEMQTAHTL